MNYDIFISHASEDKAEIALPLADKLRKRGYRVWLDSFELTVGDSLREKIDEGLANSKFGAILLSKSFFAKEWPKRELNALHARASEGDKVILPIWHGINRHDVARYSPLLADVLAANTIEGLDSVVDSLVLAMNRPSGSETTAGLRMKQPYVYKLSAGGVLGTDSVYAERTTDHEIPGRLQSKTHGLVTLRAPRSMGKTSMLLRLGQNAKEMGRNVVHLDMTCIGYITDDCTWLNHFAGYLADSLNTNFEDSRSYSPETLVSMLLDVSSDTLITVDEINTLSNNQAKLLMEIVQAVTHKQLGARVGHVFFVLSFEPLNEQIKSTMVPQSELGYHTRLRPLSISETSRVFELARMSVPVEQVSEVQKWSGGYPFLVQMYAKAIQNGRPIADATKSLLDHGSYLFDYQNHLLDDDDEYLIRQLVKGKKLPVDRLRKLIDLEIVDQAEGNWSFNSLLIKKYYFQQVQFGLGRRSWWRFW